MLRFREMATKRQRPTLAISSPSISFEARFATPVVRLLAPEREALDKLLMAMSKFGARLENLKIDVMPSDLAGSTISAAVLGGLATVYLGAARTGIQFASFPAPELLGDSVSSIADDLLQAAKSADSRVEAESYVFGMNAHAIMEGDSPDKFVGRYVKPVPRSLGKRSFSGAFYEIQPSGDEIERLTMGFEPSRNIRPNGLYVHGEAVLSATVGTPSEASKVLGEYMRKALGAPTFPVEVQWQSRSVS